MKVFCQHFYIFYQYIYKLGVRIILKSIKAKPIILPQNSGESWPTMTNNFYTITGQHQQNKNK